MKAYKHWVYVGMLWIAWSLPSKLIAQNTYSLQSCVDAALKNNLQVEASQLDLARANAQIDKAKSGLYPNIHFSTQYQYQFKVPVQLIPADVFGGPVGVYTAAQLSVPQTKTVGLQLQQALFNPSVLIALKAAKIVVSMSDLQVKNTKEELVYNVMATYYNIQSLMAQANLLRENTQRLESLLQHLSTLQKAGLATQIDVERLSISKENTQANIEATQNTIDKYLNLLKTLMNEPLEKAIALESFQEKDVPVPSTPSVFAAPSNRTNYLQVLEQKNGALLEAQNIKAGALPRLYLTGTQGFSGFYTNANPFENLNNRWYPSTAVALQLSFPIFDGFARKNDMKIKSLEIKKMDLQLQQIQQQNNQEVANALADLKSNFITYQNQKRNLLLAQKVQEDINLQYKSGLAKITDVLNTEIELKNAQNNYLGALINIKLAELNLKKAQGTLL